MKCLLNVLTKIEKLDKALEKFVNSRYNSKSRIKCNSRKKKRKNGGRKWQPKKKIYGFY